MSGDVRKVDLHRILDGYEAVRSLSLDCLLSLHLETMSAISKVTRCSDVLSLNGTFKLTRHQLIE